MSKTINTLILITAIGLCSVVVVRELLLADSGVVQVSAVVAGCVDTTWQPDAENTCAGQNFIQTSNCNSSRSAIGTRTCQGGSVAIQQSQKVLTGSPAVNNLLVNKISVDGSTVKWESDREVGAILRYGFTTDCELAKMNNTIGARSGSFELTDLAIDARYFFCLELVDKFGNKAKATGFFDTASSESMAKKIKDLFNKQVELKKTCSSPADINRDRKVGLADFNLLVKNYRKLTNTKADLNCDKKISLKDFSLLFYYWKSGK